jgi:hypothetical protein
MGASITPDQLNQDQDGAFEVWMDNWATLRAWLAAETQWRVVATMAGLIWIGLDYSGLNVVLERLRSPDHVFDDIQEMEKTALHILAGDAG